MKKINLENLSAFPYSIMTIKKQQMKVTKVVYQSTRTWGFI